MSRVEQLQGTSTRLCAWSEVDGDISTKVATLLITPFDSAQSVLAVLPDTGADSTGDEDIVVVGDDVDMGHDTRKMETQLEDRIDIAG
jgi:hypothetical protein